MTFYKLTDPIRRGDVIRAEGRKHYSYSFGPCQWVRTTIMMAYMNPDSPLYEQYEEIPEQEARELVLAKSARLARLLPKAEAMARHYHEGQTDKAGQPYIRHVQAVADQLDDLEQKITAWLHDLCEDTPVTPQLLLEEDFTPRIVQAVQVLTKPKGMDYYEYIRAVRRDSIARAVKMADLNHNMDLSRLPQVSQQDLARREKYQRAFEYLNLEKELPEREPPQDQAFSPTMEVFRAVSREAVQGRKLPHGVSHPVLRTWEGRLCLAFFVYFYQKKDLDDMAFPRPSAWLLADLRSGQITGRFSCAQQDFSRQPTDRRWSMKHPSRPNDADGLCRRLYAQLDSVRESCLEGRGLDRGAYDAYLENILRLVPPDYRVFYQELSAP